MIFTTKRNAREVERALHSYMYDKGRYIEGEHSHTQEWAEMSANEAIAIFQIVEANADTVYPTGAQLERRKGHPVDVGGICLFPYKEVRFLNQKVAVSLIGVVRERVRPLPA